MNTRHTGWLVRIYLFTLLLLLPVDYFFPTAVLFREGGAKPAIPLMVLGAGALLTRRWRTFFDGLDLPSFRTAQVLLGIGLLGTLAFGINLFRGWSYFGGGKDPIAQASAQFILFLLLPLIAIAHADLFSDPQLTVILEKQLPVIVVIHLVCIGLEASGVLDPSRLPLSLFRTPGDIPGKQPSGLMTEPSYVGVMAACYGLILCLVEFKKSNFYRRSLGVAIILVALTMGGKTVVPAMIAGGMVFLWQIRAKIVSVKTVGAGLVAVAISTYVVLSFSALDVYANQSTAMRFGSTVLAWHAANSGFGLTGVGFGQFHFFYRPEFAPAFLAYSVEATEQFSRNVSTRASTYNLFSRYLVETGVLGLAAFAGLMMYMLRLARRSATATVRIGGILFGSSLGFLLTQDPYCYPPLALGMALILASTKLKAQTEIVATR